MKGLSRYLCDFQNSTMQQAMRDLPTRSVSVPNSYSDKRTELATDTTQFYSRFLSAQRPHKSAATMRSSRARRRPASQSSRARSQETHSGQNQQAGENGCELWHSAGGNQRRTWCNTGPLDTGGLKCARRRLLRCFICFDPCDGTPNPPSAWISSMTVPLGLLIPI